MNNNSNKQGSERKERTRGKTTLGIVLVVGGILVAFVGYWLATPSGTYLIPIGAIISGIILLVRSSAVSGELTEYYKDQEYHLTSNGWVVGTTYFCGEASIIVGAPQDRIETWVKHIAKSSDMPDEVITWEHTWSLEDYSAVDAGSLHNKYPMPD